MSSCLNHKMCAVKNDLATRGWKVGTQTSSVAAWDSFEAATRITPHVRCTALLDSPWLAAMGPGCSRVMLKMESEQITGSFKVRGAVNKILSLSDAVLRGGIVTSSSGNHALAVLHAYTLLDARDPTSSTTSSTLEPPDRSASPVPASNDATATSLTDPASNHDAGVSPACAVLPSAQESRAQQPLGSQSAEAPCQRHFPPPCIYLPTSVARHKLDKLVRLGANVVLHGQDVVTAEMEGRRVAEAAGGTFISPYNDSEIIAGQGTIAIELLQALPPDQLDAVFVPVGGGGLISGIAAVLKAVAPGVRVVGCQPAASDVMRRSVLAGGIVEEGACGETLSEATAGGIEPGSVTFPTCASLVDLWVTVSEEEISAAMAGVKQRHDKVIEGAAAVAVSAYVQLVKAGSLAGQHVCIICCGGNVSSGVLPT